MLSTLYKPKLIPHNLKVKEDYESFKLESLININNPHDKFFKETFGDITVAKDFLNHYLPAEILHITDLDTLEPQKDTFIAEHLTENFSDLLFKVNLLGHPGYFYILFEHKSYPDQNIVLQLLQYMLEIWKTKINKEHNRKIPLVIPLVIYHGKNSWNAPESLDKMIVGYPLFPNDIKNYIPNFEYVLYNLSQFSDEEINGSYKLKAYLTICRDILTDDNTQFMHSIFRAIDFLLQIEDFETRVSYLQVLFLYIFSAGKNLTKKEVNRVLKKIPEGREIVMTLAELYRKEGEQRGIEKGIEKAKLEVVKNSLQIGFSIDDIVRITGLSKEEIEKVKSELNFK